MKEILTAWQWDGPVSEPVPYGEGHINQTYAITVTSEQGAKRYILQKISVIFSKKSGNSLAFYNKVCYLVYVKGV